MEEESKNVRELLIGCAHVLPRLATIATGVTGSRSDSEDIVQQAIEIAIRKEQTFQTENQFIGWLAGVVRNCALNHRRKKQRRKTYSTDPVEMSVAARTPESASPIDVASGELTPLQQTFDDKLSTALMRLESKMRICVLLRIVDGLNYKDISQAMNIPEQTAMNLVHQGKTKLRNSLRSLDQSRLGSQA